MWRSAFPARVDSAVDPLDKGELQHLRCLKNSSATSPESFDGRPGSGLQRSEPDVRDIADELIGVGFSGGGGTGAERPGGGEYLRSAAGGRCWSRRDQIRPCR